MIHLLEIFFTFHFSATLSCCLYRRQFLYFDLYSAKLSFWENPRRLWGDNWDLGRSRDAMQRRMASVCVNQPCKKLYVNIKSFPVGKKDQ